MQRIDFLVDDFDKLIKEKGMNVLWEEAMLCSCIGHTGQPDYNCPYCKGSGFIYAEPKETIVASTKLVGKKVFDDIGMREAGTAYITSLSTVLLGYHDRLTFVDYTAKYSQTIQIKFGKSLKLKRKIKSLVAVRYRGLNIDIQKVEIINDGWGIKIPSELISDYKYEGKADDPNNYSVSLLFITAPVYSILDITHELRATTIGNSSTFRELPKQYQIKREDFTYEQG